MILKINNLLKSILAKIDRWSAGSPSRKVFNVTIVVTVSTALSGLVLFIQDLLVANYFGRSDVIDAFLIAYAIPYFIINVVGGSFSAALIPEITKIRKQQNAEAANKLLTNVVTGNILLLVILAAVIAISSPFVLPLLAQGFDAQKLALSQHLTYVLAFTVIFNGIAGVWKSALNAQKHFLVPSATGILTPLVTILSLVFWTSAGIYRLALGMVGGAMLEVAILAWMMKRYRYPMALSWNGLTPEFRQVIRQYWPMIVGASITSSMKLVDRSMAASLPSGSVAALDYGAKLVNIPLFLFVSSLATAVLPYASRMVSSQNWGGLRHMLQRYLLLIFGITLPLTLGIFIFSEPITRIVFQRGAFTADDTLIVAQIQAFNALQIPFYTAGILFVRMVSAIQANAIIMIVSIICFIAKILFNNLFIRWFGVSGIALSTSAIYMISFTLNGIFFFLKLSKKSQPAQVPKDE